MSSCHPCKKQSRRDEKEIFKWSKEKQTVALNILEILPEKPRNKEHGRDNVEVGIMI